MCISIQAIICYRQLYITLLTLLIFCEYELYYIFYLLLLFSSLYICCLQALNFSLFQCQSLKWLLVTMETVDTVLVHKQLGVWQNMGVRDSIFMKKTWSLSSFFQNGDFLLLLCFHSLLVIYLQPCTQPISLNISIISTIQ